MARLAALALVAALTTGCGLEPADRPDASGPARPVDGGSTDAGGRAGEAPDADAGSAREPDGTAPDEQVAGPAVPPYAPAGPPPGVAKPEQALRDFLAAERSALELPSLALSTPLDEAAEAHASFLAQHRDTYLDNGWNPHEQPEELEGFTGEKTADRTEHFGFEGNVRGELITFETSSVAAARSWLEALYHRLPLLDASAGLLGYGRARVEDETIHVLLLGREGNGQGPPGEGEPPDDDGPPDDEGPPDEDGGPPDDAPGQSPSPQPPGDANAPPEDPPGPEDSPGGSPRLLAWPPPGDTEVPAKWSGSEVPRPPAPESGYPSGPVITLQATSGELTDAEIEVATASGEPVEAKVLSSSNDANLSPAAVAALPAAPLEGDTTYEVTVTATRDGEPVEQSWTFRTRRPSCDLLTQDCGPGKGCYPGSVSGPAQCLWTGAATTGEACRHLNDCAPGRICLGSRCQPVCADGEGGEASCEQTCPHRSTKAPSFVEQPGLGVCLGPSCAADRDLCGEREGCYWAGDFVCDWAGEGEAGESCSSVGSCEPGLACLRVGSDDPLRCRRLCRGDGGAGWPACPATCSDGARPVDGESGVKLCQ